MVPALLNLAIVSQQYLRDRRLALQKYQEYLALKPAPPNAEAVSVVVRQLDQELNPAAYPPASRPAETNLSRPAPAPSATERRWECRARGQRDPSRRRPPTRPGRLPRLPGCDRARRARPRRPCL